MRPLLVWRGYWIDEGYVMSGFKGTPGPWANVGGWVDAENPRRITICKMGQIIKETTEQVQDANASLIAAAPELLEALLDVLNLQTRGFVVLGEKVSTKAKSAINKALGVSDE